MCSYLLNSCSRKLVIFCHEIVKGKADFCPLTNPLTKILNVFFLKHKASCIHSQNLNLKFTLYAEKQKREISLGDRLD